MTTRSSKEVAQLVEETRSPLRLLDEREKRWRQIESGVYDFTPDIPKTLWPNLTKPVIVRSRSVTQDVALIRSILGWPLRVTVSLNEGEPAKSREEELALFLSHCLFRMDPDNRAKRRLQRAMATLRFGAVWLSLKEREPPKKRETESAGAFKEREEAYEGQYWRYGLEALNPGTVGFLERNGQISIAVIEQDIPVVDLMRYVESGKRDGLPLEVLRRSFPWLRATDGQPLYDNRDPLKERLRLYTVDDGNTICYYVEQKGQGRDDGGRYVVGGRHFEQLVEDYANPWGEPSLIIFPGNMREDAPMAERYEPVAAPLIENQYQVDLMTSMAMTVSANQRWVQTADDNTAQVLSSMIAGGQTEAYETFVELQQKTLAAGGVPFSLGQFQDVSGKLGDEFWRIYQRKLDERQELKSALLLLNPTPEMIERAPGVSILASMEAGMRMFEVPEEEIITGYQRMLRMIAHDCAYGRYSKLGKDYEFKTSGNENVAVAPVKAGRGYTLSPPAFEKLLTTGRINVQTMTKTPAQQAAEGQVMTERALSRIPTATPLDVVQAYGEADASGKLVEVAAWNNVQRLAPSFVRALEQAGSFKAAAMFETDPEP